MTTWHWRVFHLLCITRGNIEPAPNLAAKYAKKEPRRVGVSRNRCGAGGGATSFFELLSDFSIEVSIVWETLNRKMIFRVSFSFFLCIYFL